MLPFSTYRRLLSRLFLSTHARAFTGPTWAHRTHLSRLSGPTIHYLSLAIRTLPAQPRKATNNPDYSHHSPQTSATTSDKPADSGADESNFWLQPPSWRVVRGPASRILAGAPSCVHLPFTLVRTKILPHSPNWSLRNYHPLPPFPNFDPLCNLLPVLAIFPNAVPDRAIGVRTRCDAGAVIATLAHLSHSYRHVQVNLALSSEFLPDF